MKKGFTVLEMILVLTVVSIIVLVTVPNIAQKKEVINNVGCKALLEVVNGQILMYELNTGEQPGSVEDLVSEDYLTEDQCYCPNGDYIHIEDGQAVAS